ncbi:MAG: putative glycoside hydrolase, partial [Candidatus Staskawiczbacteria bacterium]
QIAAVKNSEPAGSPAAALQVLTPAPALPALAKFRPWLQDFNMGADYTADMVEQEIKAVEDSLGSDYNGFMLWNPSNIYTQEAIKPETK